MQNSGITSGQSDAFAVDAILNSPNVGMLQDPIDRDLIWIYQSFDELKKYSGQYYSRCPKQTNKRGDVIATFSTDYFGNGNSFTISAYEALEEMPYGFENAVSRMEIAQDRNYIYVFENANYGYTLDHRRVLRQ